MLRLLSGLALCLLLPLSALAGDWDGQPNRYRVRIDAEASRAVVEADLRPPAVTVIGPAVAALSAPPA